MSAVSPGGGLVVEGLAVAGMPCARPPRQTVPRLQHPGQTVPWLQAPGPAAPPAQSQSLPGLNRRCTLRCGPPRCGPTASMNHHTAAKNNMDKTTGPNNRGKQSWWHCCNADKKTKGGPPDRKESNLPRPGWMSCCRRRRPQGAMPVTARCLDSQARDHLGWNPVGSLGSMPHSPPRWTPPRATGPGAPSTRTADKPTSGCTGHTIRAKMHSRHHCWPHKAHNEISHRLRRSNPR